MMSLYFFQSSSESVAKVCGVSMFYLSVGESFVCYSLLSLIRPVSVWGTSDLVIGSGYLVKKDDSFFG